MITLMKIKEKVNLEIKGVSHHRKISIKLPSVFSEENLESRRKKEEISTNWK